MFDVFHYLSQIGTDANRHQHAMTSLILTPPHALVVQAVKAHIHGRIVMHEILKHPLTQKYFPINVMLAVECALLRDASLLCDFNTTRSLVLGAISYELLAKVVGRALEPSATSSCP